MIPERLEKQIQFIKEIDKLKSIIRQTNLIDNSRQENSAEHSWHLAMLAITLAEHSNEEMDLLKAVKLTLIHDIIEIDAGDTFAYDVEAYKNKEEREKKAADRIFNILPEDQALEFRQLWDEFEEQKTNESKFANAVDRLQPFLLNYNSGGASWKKHNIKKSQVIERNSAIEKASNELNKFSLELIEGAIKKGMLKED